MTTIYSSISSFPFHTLSTHCLPSPSQIIALHLITPYPTAPHRIPLTRRSTDPSIHPFIHPFIHQLINRHQKKKNVLRKQSILPCCTLKPSNQQLVHRSEFKKYLMAEVSKSEYLLCSFSFFILDLHLHHYHHRHHHHRQRFLILFFFLFFFPFIFIF